MGNVLMRRLPELSAILNTDLVGDWWTHAAASLGALLFPLVFAEAVNHFFQQPLFGRLGLVLNDDDDASREAVGAITTTTSSSSSGGESGGGILVGGSSSSSSLDFVHLAYGYLPLCWAANLAHWSGR